MIMFYQMFRSFNDSFAKQYQLALNKVKLFQIVIICLIVDTLKSEIMLIKVFQYGDR